jgi:cytidylate kinase
MKHNVICIERKRGSGGHIIGELVAKELGLNFYDNNLVDLAKSYGDITSDILDKADEMRTNPFHYKLHYEGNEKVIKERPAEEILFQLQNDVIREIAEREDCVFVGRCSDVVLEDKAVNSLSVFVTAPLEFRVQHTMEEEKLNRKQALALVKKIDKQRSDYYHHFAKREWDLAINYDIVINSAHFGIKGTAKLICDIYKNGMLKGHV